MTDGHCYLDGQKNAFCRTARQFSYLCLKILEKKRNTTWAGPLAGKGFHTLHGITYFSDHKNVKVKGKESVKYRS